MRLQQSAKITKGRAPLTYLDFHPLKHFAKSPLQIVICVLIQSDFHRNDRLELIMISFLADLMELQGMDIPWGILSLVKG